MFWINMRKFKGHHIMMDNAPIYKNGDIEKEINRHGYDRIYLPPYSSELNPIEQFWSVCKSKNKKRIAVARGDVILKNT
jgi:transposase